MNINNDKLSAINDHLFIPEFKVLEINQGNKTDYFVLREFTAANLFLYLKYLEYIDIDINEEKIANEVVKEKNTRIVVNNKYNEIILIEILKLTFGKQFDKLSIYIKEDTQVFQTLLDEIKQINHIDDLFKYVDNSDDSSSKNNDYIKSLGKMLLVFASEWGAGNPNDILEHMTLRNLMWYVDLHLDNQEDIKNINNKGLSDKEREIMADLNRKKYDSSCVSIVEGSEEDKEKAREAAKLRQLQKKLDKSNTVIIDTTGKDNQVDLMQQKFVKDFYRNMPAGMKMTEDSEGMITYSKTTRVNR